MDNAIGQMNTTTVNVTTSSSSITNAYCGRDLISFRNELISFYGVLTTVTCCLGMLTNVVNIVVLTRKNMSRSATNSILTGIAVADLLFLISILTFNLISYDVIETEVCVKHSYAVQVLLLFTIRSALTMHSVSVMLTLILAVWRYVAVTYPLKIREWCSLHRTFVAIVASYVVVPLSNIVLYLSKTVVSVNSIDTESKALTIVVGPTRSTNSCSELYDIGVTEVAKLGNNSFQNVGFWMYGVIFKIVPSIALVVFSLILVRVLYISSRQRSKLTNNSTGGPTSLDRSCLRTTKMLLAVLLLFVITELPQGVLLMLSAVLGNQFYTSCYTDLVEVNDLLEILNSSLNFIFYYAMSKQFRRTFLCLFAPGMVHERGSSKSLESTTTQIETNC